MSAHDLPYDLSLSPRSSISASSLKRPLPPPPPPPPPSTPPQPSIKLLFSLLPRKYFLCLLLPAVSSSIIAGGVAPFMTYVIGQAFDAFALFPLSPNPPQPAKDALLNSVGMAALELLALGVGSFALGSVTSSLWIWTGERNAMQVRKAVYRSVVKKDMVWFDTRLGDQDAGGLMAKFTRETDDVRMATSLASGYLIQYLTTTLTCLLLAFIRSWSLTLIILSSLPLLIIIQSFSQSIAAPLLNHERTSTTTTATLINRTLTSLPTVKAFNAQHLELLRASHAFEVLRLAAKKLNKVWGVTSAMAQFVMMGMFVQAFWFGSKLVRDGKISAGDVMATFWACLIATSNLQMCIPQFITLAKGKFSMAALMEIIHDSSSSSTLPTSPLPRSSSSSQFKAHSRFLRKITPSKCYGELSLHSLSFSYPSKPHIPVLSNISLYLPANETTFIVGSSGSGKSTIAALLMRMYEPNEGTIMLDDQDVRFLDDEWVNGHIAGVSQGFGDVVILEGKSLWENVAVGVYGRLGNINNVTKEEVEEACRMAMVHEFVEDLPEGYETVLGSSAAGNGVGLSGGQRQRLAIARARIRDPTILILDEATSALDATSRILVFEAIKNWRRNKTTIVITHDLSQIQNQDFVYVLKSGKVVEQGYRADLERVSIPENGEDDGGIGEFRKMMEIQRDMGGFPEKNVEKSEEVVKGEEEEEQEEEEERNEKRLSLNTIRPLTFGNWMFDVVADLTSQISSSSPPDSTPQRPTKEKRISKSPSRFLPFPSPIPEEEEEENAQYVIQRRLRRPSSVLLTPVTPFTAVPPGRIDSRRLSLPMSPTSTLFSQSFSKVNLTKDKEEEEEEKRFDEQKDAVRGAGRVAVQNRTRTRPPKLTVRIPTPNVEEQPLVEEQPPKFWSLMRKAWPSIPSKSLLIIGLLICLLSGTITPIFSFLLSRLLFEVSIGAKNISTINTFGAIVLGITALDGILLGLKYYVMESVGMRWTTKLRNVAYEKVLGQDKAWFDVDSDKRSEARLIQVIVKDGDDARNLVSVVIGQCLVVLAMLSVGLVWAMIRGWELTFVGIGITPLFAGVMAIQTRLVGNCEVRNKRAREDVAKGWYEVLCNVKGIRSMGIQKPFWISFEEAVERALKTGVRGAWVEGGTHGVASGLIYGAEAVLFYVGAVLVAKGRYSYLQMVEVLNLVVFSVTIGSQLMAFTEKIAKSVQATHDLMTLTDLSTSTTSESKGILKPSLSLLASGPISFENVSFSYPSRPSIPTLKNFNLVIDQGECIALVGASGSGKSTITALLQRLYEPTYGRIRFGGVGIEDVDVKWLRGGLGVVSQSPQLFEEKSVEENILYGIDLDEEEEEKRNVVRRVAGLANVDWLSGGDEAFKTPLGEISGGQAQRIQIARALARGGVHLLILDECTSALDVENQKEVLEAIHNIRRMGRGGIRMVVVTHKVEVMRMCDRVVVLKDGEVCEEGRYEELVGRKGGVFRELARGGVWET